MPVTDERRAFDHFMKVPGISRHMRTFLRLAVASAACLAAPRAAHAQIIRDPVGARAPTAAADTSATPIVTARRIQAGFEQFRRTHLPPYHGGRPGNCDETVGRFCYWYDEHAKPTPELPEVTARRKALIRSLDSLARKAPGDDWILGQRVRYDIEDERPADALAAARRCDSGTWWCDIMVGFSLHMLGQYEQADSVYDVAIGKMLPRDQCAWRDISLLLDPDALQQYRRYTCDDPARRTFEDRAWWLARTLYLMHGNDSRTEHFARMTMALLMRESATPHQYGFDDDERELMLRFGWPTAWMRGSSSDPRNGAGFDIVSHEPVPAYRYIPPGFVLNNPSASDSADWRLQLPPVIGRYAPPYAKIVKPLEHQKAMFRRGDSALIVVAYDTRDDPEFANTQVEAALTVSPGDTPHAYQGRLSNKPAGYITVTAPWGPLIMSAEVAAPHHAAVARARYGIRPPYAVGARVSLSDLLFYKPYGAFPANADEAIPHALPTERVLASEKLGVFWEAYNTDPAGERMQVSLRVVPDDAEQQPSGNFLKRALGFGSREIVPVSITVQDMSAFGAKVSPRALEVDISTLPKGSYIVNLEVEVAGQYVIRADHRIEIVGS